MIDHIGIRVFNYESAKSFYEKAFAPLGLTVLMGQDNVYHGFGKDKPFFWISKAESAEAATRGIHVAISASSADEVNAFYAAAIAAGGKDNGAPGPRTEYHPGYYGAFVLDENGNNIEAVFHGFTG